MATALDADQALADIPGTQPDVIGMAEAVAKANGDEPLMRIRQRCKAPIIILGEDKEERAGVHFLGSGADVYMAQPLNLTLLLASVRSLLRRSKGIEKR